MSFDTRLSQNQSADNIEPNMDVNHLEPLSTEQMISKGAIDIVPEVV